MQNTYEFFRDFSGPVMYFVQNIILTITAVYAWRAISESKKNANLQIENQESVAKRRATLDLILNLQADEKYIEAKSIVSRMKNNDVNPASLRDKLLNRTPPDNERTDIAGQYKACQYLLSKLAIFASGIQNGLLDEAVFKSYYYSTYIVYHEYLRGYILELREAIKRDNNLPFYGTIYQENIWLMQRWQQNPLKDDGKGTI